MASLASGVFHICGTPSPVTFWYSFSGKLYKAMPCARLYPREHSMMMRFSCTICPYIYIFLPSQTNRTSLLGKGWLGVESWQDSFSLFLSPFKFQLSHFKKRQRVYRNRVGFKDYLYYNIRISFLKRLQ